MNDRDSNRTRRRQGCRATGAAFGVMLVLTWGAAARAQQHPGAEAVGSTTKPDRPPTAQTHPQSPELWDADQMMEDAVQQISRRYNLNKAQENYTRLLLVERCRAFLGEYEPEIRELLRESIDLRLNLSKASPEAYKSWAERALPIYEAAQKAILEGNTEWRDVLNEEQKKLHDQDLAQMKASFVQVARMMDQWKEGKGPGVATTAPQTGPGEGKPPDQSVSVINKNVEDNWLAYVSKFIQAYHLDDKQANSAKVKIYTEFFDQAKRHRDRHKSDFEKIEAELKSPKADTKPKDLILRKAEMEKPIQSMFVAMHRRLTTLPTREQEASVSPEDKRQLEVWYKTLSGQFDPKAPTNIGATGRPDTQPATTAPAKRRAEEAKPAASQPAEQQPSKPPPPATSRPAKSDATGSAPSDEQPQPSGKGTKPTAAPEKPATPAASRPAT